MTTHRSEFWVFHPYRARYVLRYASADEFIDYYFGQDYSTSTTIDERGCVWYWIRTGGRFHNVAAFVWAGDDPYPLPSEEAPPPPPKPPGLWRRFILWATSTAAIVLMNYGLWNL
jgi:hypothetical protein